MKKPSILVAWFAVPVAAAAGYWGGRERSLWTGTPNTASRKTVEASAAVIPGMAVAWVNRLEKCSAAELPGVFAEIDALKESEIKSNALKLLCARWVDVDAPGGMAFFTRRREDLSGPKNAYAPGRVYLLTEWALRDPERAYEAAERLGQAGRDDMYYAGKQVLHEDPVRFWIWFQKARLPSPLEEDPAWAPVMTAHFNELIAMSADLTGTGNGANASAFYKMLAAGMAAGDPAQAIEWAKSLPVDVRDHTITAALSALARRQPEGILEFLPLLKDLPPGGRNGNTGADEILKTAMESMTARNPAAALKWASDHQTELHGFIRESNGAVAGALSAAMRDDRLTPEQAFKAVRALGEDAKELRDDLLRKMWGELHIDQLEPAAVWLKTFDRDDPSCPPALEGLLREWGQRDAAAAFAFAGQLNNPSIANDCYQQTVYEASRTGGLLPRNRRIVDTLALVPPEVRADILYEHLHTWYGNDADRPDSSFNSPGFAALLTGLPESESKDRAVKTVAAKWAGSDPLAALEWATVQTDGSVREKAADATVEAWVKQDAWGASEWIKSQPEGAVRDTGALRLARFLRTDEPQSAWEWAGNITDPATRLEARSAVLETWRNSPGAGANAALEAISASLTNTERQRLADTLAGRTTTK